MYKRIITIIYETIRLFNECIDFVRHGLFIETLRALRTILLRKLGKPMLKSIFICPSHECNANCTHCYEKFLHKKFKHSMTTSEIKKTIDQFHKLGGFRVFFCSGEFLLREDALELIRYTRSKRIIVWIVSNGILLDEKKIKELKEAGLTQLVISIDSANPGTHDKLRRVDGCFEKATEALKIAKKNGISTYIWTYVTKTNFNELDGIVKLGIKLKTQYTFVYFPLLSGNLFNSFEENLTFEEREAFRKEFNPGKGVLLEFASEESICIGGGHFHICVKPSGDVTFCPPVPYSYGNIKTDQLKDCFLKIKKDHEKFCLKECTGQCIVNFKEYRENCNAKFIYNK